MLTQRTQKILAAGASVGASFIFFELSQAAFFDNTAAYYGVFALQDGEIFFDSTLLLATLGAALLYLLYSFLSAISIQIALSIGGALTYSKPTERIRISACIGAILIVSSLLTLIACLIAPVRAFAAHVLAIALFPITLVRLPSLIAMIAGVCVYPWIVVHWMKYAHI